MKIKALIDILQTLDPELEVVVASDEEGNSFHSLAAYGGGRWEPEDRSFTAYTDEDEEDEDGNYLPERVLEVNEWNAIVLWP